MDESKLTTQIKPKIILVTMARSSYLATDALGQLRLQYPANVYVLNTLYPGILPAYFFVESLKKGIDGIIIAAAGADCPVELSYSQLSESVKQAHAQLKQDGLSLKRLRLTAICSVCTNALLKEINQMSEFVINLKKEGKQ